MDVTKIVCDGFIKYIKENNITGDDIAFELMDKVNEKAITPKELVAIIEKLGLHENKSTIEVMSKCRQEVKVILQPKYENILKMNYRELEFYNDYLKRNNIDEKTIFNKLLDDFQDGKVLARDLQYILEVFGYDIDENFKNETIKHGLYCKDISKLGDMTNNK